MPAEAQSAPAQAAKAQFDAAFEEQERLRTTLSAEEYERWRQQRVEELIQLTAEMGKYAESQGMTDEIFAQLLAQD